MDDSAVRPVSQACQLSDSGDVVTWSLFVNRHLAFLLD